ncbi:hypothetical protein ACFV6B_13070 [Streptomyces microflavus]|uniref:hypothetical protein n=1 Tax=Streptomyces microflavus TaxID=1919 RepID=UPI00364F3431
MADITPADPKQPAYDAVFAYIRSQPDVVPATVVERNAMIWRAVHAALDAVLPVPADRAATLRAAAQSAGVQPPIEGEAEAGGCWCGHPEERHFTSQAMTLPNGCHDCQGWNGAHAYGQDLPWAAAPATPEEQAR